MLYIVATPIGNLSDITLRTIETLKIVNIVLAEDTRRAKILLDRYQIETTKLVSFHEHSGDSKISWIIEQLDSGKDVALVTDAGTPGVSDPGGKLIAAAIKENIKVVPIPGPSALATILSLVPWPAEPVLFVGYLPKKKGRQTFLKNLKDFEGTLVFFESPFRIIRTLEDLKELLGDRQVVVGRELTKQFEDIYYGDLSGAVKHFSVKQKGEFTIALRCSTRAVKPEPGQY